MTSWLDSLGSVCGIAEQLVPRVPRNGHNDVYVGHVVSPQGARERTYVKVYGRDEGGLRVFNEVIAHSIALQCGLLSPLTFPCAVRKCFLRAESPALAESDASSDFVLGVASVDGASSEVRQRIRASEATILDVINWSYVARVAVFDELMGNDDRRIDNLVRRGLHDYAIIDNERIVFGMRWFDLDLTNLEAKPCDPNILADTLAGAIDESGRQRMMDAANHLMRVTPLFVPNMSENLERLCGASLGATQRLVQMLNRRRMGIRNLLQWHLRIGDLFQARTNQ
jgi:hypothetical protein